MRHYSLGGSHLKYIQLTTNEMVSIALCPTDVIEQRAVNLDMLALYHLNWQHLNQRCECWPTFLIDID
jgi:hypothetical protein